MPFCTIVEFEWDAGFDELAFEHAMESMGSGADRPGGRLSRITDVDDTGAQVIEVWQSPFWRAGQGACRIDRPDSCEGPVAATVPGGRIRSHSVRCRRR